MTILELIDDRNRLAVLLRRYLPQHGKQDMTNHDRDLVEWVDGIIAESQTSILHQIQPDTE